MSNSKFCFNKSFVFFGGVFVLALVGVFTFNSLTQVKTSTSTRAAFLDSSNCGNVDGESCCAPRTCYDDMKCVTEFKGYNKAPAAVCRRFNSIAGKTDLSPCRGDDCNSGLSCMKNGVNISDVTELSIGIPAIEINPWLENPISPINRVSQLLAPSTALSDGICYSERCGGIGEDCCANNVCDVGRCVAYPPTNGTITIQRANPSLPTIRTTTNYCSNYSHIYVLDNTEKNMTLIEKTNMDFQLKRSMLYIDETGNDIASLMIWTDVMKKNTLEDPKILLKCGFTDLPLAQIFTGYGFGQALNCSINDIKTGGNTITVSVVDSKNPSIETVSKLYYVTFRVPTATPVITQTSPTTSPTITTMPTASAPRPAVTGSRRLIPQ